MNHRLLFLTVFALVAAPALAGCAADDTTAPTATTTAAPTPTPTMMTPTPTSSPMVPTVTPPTPVVPVLKPLDLKMGTIMPLTGELNSIGKQMQNSAHLAVDEINAAEATFMFKVTVVADEDDKTGDAAAAGDAYERVVAKDADAIVGPCCSGVSRALIPKAAEDEVILASPSATAPDITDPAKTDGYFWRVSPTDEGQGRVLADMVAGDGVKKVSLIIVNNDYGNGFAGIFKTRFEAKGGTVPVIAKYAEVGATTFDSQVDEAAAASPEAIVLVAYADAGASIMRTAFTKGLLSTYKWYASEGLHASGFIEKAGKTTDGKWVVAGVKGTFPHVENSTAFNTAYATTYPDSEPGQYSPESYDAVMYVALASLKAQSTAGKDIRAAIVDIANPGGEKCSGWVACATLIAAGRDIDYQGVAHDLEFDAERREPKSGAYDLWRVTDMGEFETYEETVVPE